MTHTIRASTLASMLAAAFCLTTLTPLASKEAVAQFGRSPGMFTHTYYGYGGGYNNGYGYGNYVQNGYGYGGNPYGNYGYTGYGNGPYGYGSSTVYQYPTTVRYGYPTVTPYNAYYGNTTFGGGNYRRIYAPNYGVYYSPY